MCILRAEGRLKSSLYGLGACGELECPGWGVLTWSGVDLGTEWEGKTGQGWLTPYCHPTGNSEEHRNSKFEPRFPVIMKVCLQGLEVRAILCNSALM